MGLLNSVKLWELTDLDKMIDNYSIIFLGLLVTIMLIVHIVYMFDILVNILFIIFIFHILFEFKYNWRRAGEYKFLGESNEEFKERKHKEFKDNTPRPLTFKKMLKELYTLKKGGD